MWCTERWWSCLVSVVPEDICKVRTECFNSDVFTKIKMECASLVYRVHVSTVFCIWRPEAWAFHMLLIAARHNCAGRFEAINILIVFEQYKFSFRFHQILIFHTKFNEVETALHIEWDDIWINWILYLVKSMCITYNRLIYIYLAKDFFEIIWWHF